jgi:hypothetical protein
MQNSILNHDLIKIIDLDLPRSGWFHTNDQDPFVPFHFQVGHLEGITDGGFQWFSRQHGNIRSSYKRLIYRKEFPHGNCERAFLEILDIFGKFGYLVFGYIVCNFWIFFWNFFLEFFYFLKGWII